MKISVVIPNYNGRELLKNNLPVVLKESKNAEIIVVDDASVDDSVSLIKKKFKEVKLIEKKANSGFSSTVNLGVKNAKGDLVVLLNSDAYPEKNYIKNLLHYFDDPKTFAVGMLHKSIEGENVILRGRGIGQFKRGFVIHRRGDVNSNDTFWVNGGAGVFRKSIWNSLGGLNEIYDPFYWEDIDLSTRAVKAGFKIYFEQKSVVVHKQSKGAIRSRYSKSQIKKIAYRNQFLFVWLNFSKPEYLLSHILWFPYHLVKTREKEFLTGFLEAIKKILYDKKS